MRWLDRLTGRLRSLLRRTRVEAELDTELQFHLRQQIEENLASGMSVVEARASALRSVGGLALLKERCRDSLGVRLIDELRQDLRYASRGLLRSPGFTMVAVVTVALAIAANASIFALVQRVVLNPLPYPASDRLIEVDHGAQRLNVASGIGITPGLYYQYAERARTLEGIALYHASDVTLADNGEPERIRVAQATPSLASVLQVSPIVGRWFSEHDGTPGVSQTALLSHALWMRRYGGDLGIVGRPVMLEGAPTEIIGVMPSSFAFPDQRVDAWTVAQVARSMGFGLWTYRGVARLREGVTVARARTELNGLIADVPRAFPGDLLARANSEQIQLFAAPLTLKEATIGGVVQALWVLLGAVGLVWWVACANVANLFLVRAETRQREIALRRALGAGGGRIARSFLAESVLLSGVGGGIGFLLATSAVSVLVRLGPASLPRLHEVRMDTVSLAFTGGLTVLAAVLFGILPLGRRSSVVGSIRDGGRSNTTGHASHRARHLLMGGQVALALVLLVAAGLLTRSFHRLRSVDPGFNAQSALTFSIGLPARAYPTREAALLAHHAMLDRLAAVPGVVAVSAASCLPLAGGCYGNGLRVEGRALPAGTIPPLAMFRAVTGGYFDTMGMRVLRGRGIERGDVERREAVVVVNQALAERFFPQQDPLGQHVAPNRPPPGPGDPAIIWLTIVGVVSNTPSLSLGELHPDPQVYVPMSLAGGPDMSTTALVGPDVAVMSYVVRTAQEPFVILPGLRRAIDLVDPGLALAQVRTLQAAVDQASAQMAFTMVLLVIASGVALVLGLVGIYGVMSYLVTQRTVELGLRLALGAEPRALVRRIVGHGAIVAGLGITLGLAIAIAGSRILRSLLYGVSATDPMIFAAAALSLLGVAVLACWVPARRVLRVDPLIALRSE